MVKRSNGDNSGWFYPCFGWNGT